MTDSAKLLIVDDEKAMLQIFRRKLEGRSHEVHTASSGHEALEIMRENRIDILITDLTMPEMDGIELLQEAVRRQPDLQCIVMTGYGKIDTAVQAMRLGAINYFSKPLDFESLQMAISKGLEKKYLLEELRRKQESLEKANRELALEVKKNRKNLNFLQVLLDTIPAPVFYKDAEGIYRGCNKAFEQLLGRSREEIVGQTVYGIAPMDHAERYQQADEAIFRETGNQVYEAPVRFADGTDHDFIFHKAIYFDSDGRVAGLVGVMLDISERKKIERQLSLYRHQLEKLVEERTAELKNANEQLRQEIRERQQAEQEAESRRRQLIEADKLATIGVLVAGVAHEINNPNTFIMMNAPILRRTWEDLTPVLDSLREEKGDFNLSGLPYSEMRTHIPELFAGITDGSERIRQIVMSLKDYARKDVRDLNQQVNINEVLKAALTLLANPLKKCTHNLEVRYGKDLPPLKGNFQRMEQVLINVIQNSCQSLADPSRKILITTCIDDEGKVVIIVEDEGSGIPPEHLKHIKDPFFTTKRDCGGTGLGLSISAGIMEEHGGALLFDSRLGIGTTVRIIFPTANDR
jgi:PAS domain S-box-containing protein